MGSEASHRKSAAFARAVAEELRASQPAWALVPLFYSSMHEIHARLAAKGSANNDFYHPRHHYSHRDSQGMVLKWGTLDVVVQEFPSGIATAYRELHKISESVRYKHLEGTFDTTRFWSYADQIQAMPN